MSTCPLRQRWDQSDGGELQLGQRSTNGSLEQEEGLSVQHVSLSQAVSGVYGAIIYAYMISIIPVRTALLSFLVVEIPGTF